MPSVAFSLPFEAYQGEEPYIFVSYSHADAEVVYPDMQYFHEMGYRIWYDEGIDPGNEWRAEVENAIINSSCFIVFISPNSVASRNVRNEINLAYNRNIEFIAIYLTPTKLPSGLNLVMESIQAILKYNHTADSYARKINKTLSQKLRKKDGVNLAYPGSILAPAGLFPIETGSLDSRSQPGSDVSGAFGKTDRFPMDSAKRGRLPTWVYALGGVIILGLTFTLLNSGGWLAAGLGNKPATPAAQANNLLETTITPAIQLPIANTIVPIHDVFWKEGSILFFNDFEDGKTSDWNFEGFWKVVKDETGNSVLERAGSQSAKAHMVNNTIWRDYAFEARVKVLQPGPNEYGDTFSVLFRQQDSQSYNWHLNTSKLHFFRDPSTFFQDTSFPIPVNTWFKVRVEVIGNLIRGFIDDEQILEVTDSEPFLDGPAGFYIEPNVKIWFDDVRVVELVHK